jgi:hypothetical protein
MRGLFVVFSKGKQRTQPFDPENRKNNGAHFGSTWGSFPTMPQAKREL